MICKTGNIGQKLSIASTENDIFALSARQNNEHFFYGKVLKIFYPRGVHRFPRDDEQTRFSQSHLSALDLLGKLNGLQVTIHVNTQLSVPEAIRLQSGLGELEVLKGSFARLVTTLPSTIQSYQQSFL